MNVTQLTQVLVCLVFGRNANLFVVEEMPKIWPGSHCRERTSGMLGTGGHGEVGTAG